MAYTSAALAKVLDLGPSGRSLWFYDAGGDNATAIAGTGYITDAAEGTGVAKGAGKNMNLGDPVLVVQTSSGAGAGINMYTVSAISAAGAGTLIKTATA